MDTPVDALLFRLAGRNGRYLRPIHAVVGKEVKCLRKTTATDKYSTLRQDYTAMEMWAPKATANLRQLGVGRVDDPYQ